MNEFLQALALLSVKGALVAALVAFVLATVGRRLPPAFRHGLWLLVFVRLLVPVAPASPTSLLALPPSGGGTLPGLRAGLLTSAFESGARAGGATGAAVASPLRHVLPAAALALWIAVFALLVVRRAAAARRLRRRLRAIAPVTDSRALRLLAEARGALRLHRPVALVASRDEGPGVIGLLRPRIVLPRELLRTLDDDDLRHVLLHELAHVRRLDGAIRAVARLVAAAHWFNPLAWYALRRLDAECESACDAAVLGHLSGDEGGRRAAYGRTLIDVAARPRRELHPLGGGLLALSRHRDLERRVLMIARYRPTSLRTALACALLLAAVAALTLTDAPVEAGPRTAREADPGEEAKTEPAEIDVGRETLDRMRSAGTAMFSWVSDAVAPGQEWPSNDPEPFDWAACPPVPPEELEALLVPKYIPRLPTTDAWGHPLEFCLDQDPEPSDVYLAGILSPGRDGIYEGDEYTPGPFLPIDADRDVVWINGYFITWPSKKAE